MELISVIIPVYNKETTVARAISSVLQQSYTDFELLIVNDGSTDSSLDKIRHISDSRIKVITQQNAGVSSARNTGIAQASGKFIAFLDADDEWDNDFLESVYKLTVDFPSANVYGTNYRLKDIKGNIYHTVIKGIDFSIDNRGIICNYFHIASISSPPICSICILARKKDLINIGGFPKGIKSGEDLLTWAKLINNGTLAYDITPHATYNLGEGYEYSSQPVRKQDEGDPVGTELLQLYHNNPTISGLKEYISHWHKMRASVAIRFGEKVETLKECILALKFNRRNIKVIPFMILAFIPSVIRKKIIALKSH